MNCPRCTTHEPPHHPERSAGRVCLGCGFTFDPVHYMSSLRERLMRDHGLSLL